jgi:DNA-directed RNA polymerase subunit RPC12/RpoP
MSIFRAVFNVFHELFLGCSHERLTRPFTLQEKTYKVCLNCGSQIYYSPVTMRPLSGRELRRMKTVQASEVRMMPVASRISAAMRGNETKSNAA